MYECLEAALCGVPMGLGEGPIKSGSNVPTPRYYRYHVTHAGSYSGTLVRFLSQIYSRQLKDVLLPHV